MYNYYDEYHGPMCFSWGHTRSLASVLTHHMLEYVLLLVDAGKLPEAAAERFRKDITQDWFLTEVLEHYVSLRDANLRQGFDGGMYYDCVGPDTIDELNDMPERGKK